MAHVEPPIKRRPTWVQSDRTVPTLFVRPVRRFMDLEASSGVILLIMAVVALIWANSASADSYFGLLDYHVVVELGDVHILDESIKHLINDGLMVLFFFVVGMEIKRELVLGELNDAKTAALPAIAAVGGMVVPALIYVAFAAGIEGAGPGWGIPMATDIAFSVGIVALLGSRVPLTAKLFLLALAIVDDIGAIAVIAIFYTTDLAFFWLLAAIALLALIYILSRTNVRLTGVYWVLGILAWYAMLESGVHATLAGVAVGLITPARPFYSSREYDALARRTIELYSADETTQDAREEVDFEVLQLSKVSRDSVAPLTRLEHALAPWTSFFVVPLFALANAGISFDGVEIGEAITSGVALGVAFGLVLGKTFGVTLFAWLAVKAGIGSMPRGANWQMMTGLAMLAGVGFTVSLFITELAFEAQSPLVDLAKIGIFLGSAVAGIGGYLLLRIRSTTA
ncbi:MAG: Na+/H+ antiporter NhaA [Acidimicrobiia bacterium]|nr:Na+/H+ antiporter NhaA [Acidimicrobiia bacterium]